MDPSTLSALAATAAALVAAGVGGIQLYVGRRQSVAALIGAKAAEINAKAAMLNAENAGRHTIAEFRQKWINTIQDTLSEHHSIMMTMRDDATYLSDDNRRLVALGTKLELMLNPNEDESAKLLALIDEMRKATDVIQRANRDKEMVALAHKILKSEWVRLNKELQA